MAIPHHAPGSLAGNLVPGRASPFTWSIFAPVAERATRAAYGRLGYRFPAEPRLFGLAEGRVTFDEAAAARANHAAFGGEATGLGGLLSREPGSRATATLLDSLQAADDCYARAEHWWRSVGEMTWTQATLLQVMEEIEPRAEAVATMVAQACLGAEAARAAILREAAEADAATRAGAIEGLGESLGVAAYRREIWELAQAASQDRALAGLVNGNRLHEWQSMLPAGRFRDLWEQFLATRGHWGPSPLEAAGPRWREWPERLLAALAAQLDGPPEQAPLAPAASQQRRRTAAGEAAKTISMLKRRRFLATVDQSVLLQDHAERGREHLVKVVDAARSWARAAAREATADGRLAKADDVFLLELEELKQMMTGEWSSPEQVRPIVEARRASWTAPQPA